MARGYNYIYKQLVEDKTDIVGHVAYSLYKADKVQYINHFKEEHGREPNEEELKPFHDASCLEGSLDGYKETAISILKGFLDRTLSETVHDIELDVQENYKDNLKEVVAPLVPKSKARQYWNGVSQSVVGAVLFALIVAAVAFIIQFKGAEFTVNVSPTHETPKVSVPATE